MSQPYPPPSPYSQPYPQPQMPPPYPPSAVSVAPQYPQNAYHPQPPIMQAGGDGPTPDILQLAATYQLGTPLQAYKPKYNVAVAICIAVGVSVLDIIVMVAILVFIGYLLYILLFIPIAMIVFAVNALRHGNAKVYVFTNGLIQSKGQQNDVIRWDQVQAVWQKITKVRYYFYYYSTTYKYTVRRNDGASFTFNNSLKRIADLGQTLQNEVTRLHTPMAMIAYNSGALVTFGLFSLGMQGIGNGREMLPWNFVKSISIKRGTMSVYKEGQMLRWASDEVANIPNYQVFVNVANHALSSFGKTVG